jgi:hypothetical protein
MIIEISRILISQKSTILKDGSREMVKNQLRKIHMLTLKNLESKEIFKKLFPKLETPVFSKEIIRNYILDDVNGEIYPTGIGFPVFPVTYPDIFHFFLRSLIPDKFPKEEK